MPDTTPRPPTFRVIDTGIGGGRHNIAFDQALIELRRDGDIPDTLRFLRFRPTVLVGRHQALSQAVDVDYCHAQGIEIGRRVTGGGALYLDERQLGWELVFDRRTLGLGSLAEVTKAVCEAAARGLSTLGIDARFRPRNDIEVDGRKLGGTGGFFDGPVIFYQGTVLLDVDPDVMLHALRVPPDKHGKHGAASVTDRVTTLSALTGAPGPAVDAVQAALLDGFRTGLGIEFTSAEPGARERAAAATWFDDEIGTDEFVAEIDAPAGEVSSFNVSRSTPGGTIEVWLTLARGNPARVESVLVTGDFFVTPPRVIPDLEAHLRGARVDALGDAIDAFFSSTPVEVLSTGSAELGAAITSAARAALAGRAA